MFTFDATTLILAGILMGIVFGALLQRAHVTRYNVILGQFLFVDFTVLKVMLTAIVVGAIGIWGMLQMGMIEHLHVKNAALAGNVLGGLIFGVGMAILGYCPGTGVAAIGDGSRHAIAGLLGMIVGAGVYAEAFPLIQDNLLKWLVVEITVDGSETSAVTLANLTGLSPWVFVALLAVIAAGVFAAVEKYERTHKVAG
jgi:uncharacterized membrane protein YedE/YeeE